MCTVTATARTMIAAAASGKYQRWRPLGTTSGAGRVWTARRAAARIASSSWRGGSSRGSSR
jgi:hypothetical protein